jgi:hypothetical protein
MWHDPWSHSGWTAPVPLNRVYWALYEAWIWLIRPVRSSRQKEIDAAYQRGRDDEREITRKLMVPKYEVERLIHRNYRKGREHQQAWFDLSVEMYVMSERHKKDFRERVFGQ